MLLPFDIETKVVGDHDEFPHPIFHRIRCNVGLVIPETSAGECKFKVFRSPGEFFAFLDAKTPKIISFNGQSFDMQVLIYEALREGVVADAYFNGGGKWAGYRNRYHDWHVDLLDELTNFGACRRASLHDVCESMGIPGKLGVAGDDVDDLTDEQVVEYCKDDVCSTAVLGLRWLKFRGQKVPDEQMVVEVASEAWRNRYFELRGE